MNPLTSQKKLLIAESELNREQLVQEWQQMTGDVRALAEQALTIRSIVAAAVPLISGLVSMRQKNPAPVIGKKSWLQTILKSAQLVGSFWSEMSAPKK